MTDKMTTNSKNSNKISFANKLSLFFEKMGFLFGISNDKDDKKKSKRRTDELTEKEKAELQIKRQRDNLIKYEKKCEQNIEKFTSSCKQWLKKKNRARAKIFLQKKKYKETMFISSPHQKKKKKYKKYSQKKKNKKFHNHPNFIIFIIFIFDFFIIFWMK